jgi:hypothetical protein
MTAYDRHIFIRSFGLALILMALVLGVMSATDGAMTSFSEKVGRLCVLAPLIGAVGMLIGNTQAVLRGEVRALAAIGVSPHRAARGGVLSILLVGAVGAILLTTQFADIHGLLPHLDSMTWTWQPDGSYRALQSGVEVSSTGIPHLHAAHHPVHIPKQNRWPIAVTVVWMTVILADWARENLSNGQRLVAVFSGSGLSIVLFHLVASERFSAWLLTLAPLPLLIQVWAHRAFDRKRK